MLWRTVRQGVDEEHRKESFTILKRRGKEVGVQGGLSQAVKDMREGASR